MPPESGGDNKRKSERVRVTASRNVWNLSEGGAYVASQNPKKAGSIVHFEYKLENTRETFSALAKVIRVLYKPNPRSGEPAGMALQFVKIDAAEKEKLRRILASIKDRPGGEGQEPPPLDFD